MKFVPIFDELTNALNFRTSISRIIGGCDLYTTKAAGTDKKLYKKIEHELETKYQELLKHAVTVPPPDDEISPMSLARPSPFGSLGQISNRRTYAYLITILNACHPDYDFSHFLNPDDFRREPSLAEVISNINASICHLRPNTEVSLQAPPVTGDLATAYIPPSDDGWCPQMWMIIDKEMVLKKCQIYSWCPERNPFEQEENSIWRLNYFFYNKELKRVTHFYVRLVSAMNEVTEYYEEVKRENKIREECDCGVDVKGKQRSSFLYAEDDESSDELDYDPESSSEE
ncbi:hypothetical protein K3495_g6237 [Podosphaera aphanis]|nr:hypothetical protein K3495_g6237 [Podosphaera aphanis]